MVRRRVPPGTLRNHEGNDCSRTPADRNYDYHIEYMLDIDPGFRDIVDADLLKDDGTFDAHMAAGAARCALPGMVLFTWLVYAFCLKGPLTTGYEKDYGERCPARATRRSCWASSTAWPCLL